MIPACNNVKCGPYEYCEFGICYPIDPCAGVKCGPKKYCESGTCFPKYIDPCYDIVCVSGKCVNGKCLVIDPPYYSDRCSTNRDCSP